MAVRDQVISTLVEALASLNQRVNSIEAVAPIEGPAGPQGEAGPPPTEQQIADAASAWLQANITQPADGKDGADGADGKDGRDGRDATPEEISIAVSAWMEINRDSLRGRDGRNGKDGRDGVDGADGPAGPRGMAGRDGAAGADGVGIALVEQRDEKSFWITLTDGQEFQINLPEPLKGGGGFVGGGVRSITSVDGTVSVSANGGVVDLSVSGGSGPTTNVVALVRNRTGSTIPKGTAVYISGATGQTSEVSLALATSDATCAQTLGLTTADIPNNQTGYVLSFGYLSDINTSAYSDGQQLYLSWTNAGKLTNVKPHAPAHLVYMAVVEYSHAVHGKLFVKVQNGYEIDELHDVLISSPSNDDILKYDAASGLWKNGPNTGGGATALASLSDVAISGMSSGDVLAFNTSSNKWVNEARVSLVDGGNF